MFKNSFELKSHINKLAERRAELMAADEPDMEAVSELNGEIKALDAQLVDMLAEEQAMRNEALAVGVTADSFVQQTAAERILGDPAKFSGVRSGTTLRASVSVPEPTKTDRSLPAGNPYQFGFIDSIVNLTEDISAAGSETYFVRNFGTWNTKAQEWKTGAKKESVIAFLERVANLSTIAHRTPVAKRALQHYATLRNIIDTELLLGLKLAKSEIALLGESETGIKGVLNIAGIKTFESIGDENAYTTIRRMITLAKQDWLAPTHVCLTSKVAEALDLMTDATGHYLRLEVSGKVWRLDVVEDDNLQTNDGDGILVYNSNAAQFIESEKENISVGFVNDQFIKNELTILGECEARLRVTHPESFVYCANAPLAITPTMNISGVVSGIGDTVE
jgi:HK97 family phage major capsid protein